MKRVFIAIDVELSPDISRVYEEFRSGLNNEQIKWVKPDNFHITLAFIGDLNDTQIASLSDKLRKVAALWKPFVIEPKGVGVFKSIENPRVLWFGLKESTPLSNLKYQVDSLLMEEKLPVDSKEFRPHLTFGRIKGKKCISGLEELLDKFESIEFTPVEINKFVFYQSILRPSGPVYKPLEIFAFKPG